MSSQNKALEKQLLAYLPLVLLLPLVWYLKQGPIFYMAWNTAIIVLSYLAALSDIRERRISNKLVLTAAGIWAIFIVLKALESMDELVALLIQSAMGFIVAGSLFLIVYFASKGGLGGGDVKFMTVMGLYLGYDGILYATLIGSVILSVLGIVLILVKKIGKKDALPFAPFLFIGILLAVSAL